MVVLILLSPSSILCFLNYENRMVPEGILRAQQIFKEDPGNQVFHPLGDTTAAGPCPWEIWTTRNENRIPSEITEVYCLGDGLSCEKNSLYKVR